MPGLPFQNLPATQSQFQQTPDPMSIIEDDVHRGLKQLTDYFDMARYDLDQQNLKPQQYLAHIDQLRQHVKEAEFTLHQKAQAKIDSMSQIVKLIQEGLLPKETGQRALWRVAGLDDEAINAMLPRTKPVDWLQEYAQNQQMENRVLNDMSDYLPSGGKLYRLKPKKPGSDEMVIDKKNPASEAETQRYNMGLNLLDEIRRKRGEEIYPNLAPLQQSALQMQRVAQTKTRQGIPAHIGETLVPFQGRQYPGKWPLGGSKFIPELLFGPQEGQSASRPAGQATYRKNPKTGEVIVSYDGGKQWWKVQ